MDIAIFKSYENGYYTFLHGIEEVVYEEIEPILLKEYDLKNDKTLKNKTFEIGFSENFVEGDEDFIIYRIEHLKLIE